MGFVLFLAGLVAVAWLAVGLKYLPHFSFNPIPVGATLFIIVASVFGAEYFSIEATIPVTFDRVFLVGLVGLFVALVFFGYDQIQPLNLTDLLVFGLFGLMMISTFTHDWQTLDNLPISRLLFFNTMPVAVYIIVRNSRLRLKELKMIAAMLAGFGVYLSLIAFAEARGWTSVVFPRYIADASAQEFYGRARGPFMNPISNGIFLIVCLASLLAWWNRVNDRIKIVIVLLIPIFVLGIFSTLTRSVWVSLPFSIALVVMITIPPRLRGGVLTIGAVCGMVLVLGVGGKMAQFKRDKFVSEAEMRQSAVLRPLFAVVAFRMFQDRPLLGHGFGQYTNAKTAYLQDPSGKYPLALTKSYSQHNLFLNYLAEMGLAGLTILIAMLLNLSWMAMAIWKNRRRYLFARYFGLIMLVILVCHVTNGMFHDVAIAPMVNMLLYFVAGITTNLFTAAHVTEISAEELARQSAQSRSTLNPLHPSRNRDLSLNPVRARQSAGPSVKG